MRDYRHKPPSCPPLKVRNDSRDIHRSGLSVASRFYCSHFPVQLLRTGPQKRGGEQGRVELDLRNSYPTRQSPNTFSSPYSRARGHHQGPRILLPIMFPVSLCLPDSYFYNMEVFYTQHKQIFSIHSVSMLHPSISPTSLPTVLHGGTTRE